MWLSPQPRGDRSAPTLLPSGKAQCRGAEEEPSTWKEHKLQGWGAVSPRSARPAEQEQGALVLNAWTSNSWVSLFPSLGLLPSLGREETEQGPSSL